MRMLKMAPLALVASMLACSASAAQNTLRGLDMAAKTADSGTEGGVIAIYVLLGLCACTVLCGCISWIGNGCRDYDARTRGPSLLAGYNSD